MTSWWEDFAQLCLWAVWVWGGIGIVAKLAGQTDWPWWVILAPFWGTLVLILGLLLIGILGLAMGGTDRGPLS